MPNKPPAYRFVLLSYHEKAFVCEVLHHDRRVHTTAAHEERGNAFDAATAWVAAQKAEKVRESAR